MTAEEQWKNFQDFGAENFSGMPLGPTGAFNPYWGGGVPLPMDYMGAPFPGPMPYMRYPPGPFDPFGGGVLPQDPFMPPGYMMPGVPRYILAPVGFCAKETRPILYVLVIFFVHLKVKEE